MVPASGPKMTINGHNRVALVHAVAIVAVLPHPTVQGVRMVQPQRQSPQPLQMAMDQHPTWAHYHHLQAVCLIQHQVSILFQR